MDVSVVADIATNACATCKKYKRKCNKALPSCSTCLSLRRPCNYSLADSARPKAEEEIALLRSQVDELQKLVKRHIVGEKAESSLTPLTGHALRDISSSLFFLDQMYFTHFHYSLQPVSIPVPSDLRKALKDEFDQPLGVDQLVGQYFDTMHHWMPIISKLRMKRILQRSRDNMQADLAFLLSCMKLLLHAPEEGSLPEALSLYRVVKTCNLQLELAGVQSLMVIQGGVLIALYEIGHGIYPAGYTTVALCARQAISLGVHNPDSPKFLQHWSDWEEQIRVWWFIVMLDRFVTLGRDLRPLCTEDPKKNTPLPIDSEAWDQGAMISPGRLYVSSPPTETTSPYARLAQAFNLLGRVIRHCNDPDPDTAFILEEMTTLNQVLFALLELTLSEESEGSYVAVAVCFSALLKLHKNWLSNSFLPRLTDTTDPELAVCVRKQADSSYNVMRDVGLRVVEFALSLERRITQPGDGKLSPLVLHCLYRAAFWLSYISNATQEDELIVGRSICCRVLEALSLRWKSGITYLQFLDTAFKGTE